ncbi:MAG: hypothetical protein RMM17_03470 [Acidobacteriota bacterium]|nr:hypothetical protein [Blastocatellia bacterium]MDW8411727.1 hypothetical protein [Acidobacteriota bacterium]
MKLLAFLAFCLGQIVPSIMPYGEPVRMEIAAGGHLAILQPEYRYDVETDFICVFDLDSGRLAARFPGTDFTLSQDRYTVYIKACAEKCQKSNYLVSLPSFEQFPLNTDTFCQRTTVQIADSKLILTSSKGKVTQLPLFVRPYQVSILDSSGKTTLIAADETVIVVTEDKATYLEHDKLQPLAGGISEKGFEIVWSDGYIISYTKKAKEFSRRKLPSTLPNGLYSYDMQSKRLVCVTEDAIQVWDEDGRYVKNRLTRAYHPGEIWFDTTATKLLVYDYYDEETRLKTLWNLSTGHPEAYENFKKARAVPSTYSVTATAEGLKFWAKDTLLATAVLTEDGWLVYTPDCKYDCEPQNIELFSLVENGRASTVSRNNYVPGLLASVLKRLK